MNICNNDAFTNLETYATTIQISDPVLYINILHYIYIIFLNN